MSAAKHTPGPWRLTDDNRARRVIKAPGQKDRSVCIIEEWTTESDARLITAAPELLAACEEMTRLYAVEEKADPLVVSPHGCNLHAGIVQLRAAIAKARGGQ